MNIEQRIHAAIRPQLDRADELLDYYTEGLPREVWEPIAAMFRPKTTGEIIIEAVNQMGKTLDQFFSGLNDAVDAFLDKLKDPPTQDDFMEVW